MSPEEVENQSIFLVGASVRAAAFSALRVGWTPWCIDLFADEDLCARCPAMQLPGDYPEGFLPWIVNGMPGPFLYTGALENWPFFVQKLAKHRTLWGNTLESTLAVRNPTYLHQLLSQRGLPALTATWEVPRLGTGGTRWIFKPVRSAGGTHIQFLDKMEVIPAELVRQCYFQEFCEGTPCSAVFAAREGKATLLGATRQLIGESWLGVGDFRYCGNIGPLELSPTLENTLVRIGNTLTEGSRLRGLFGVDGVVRDEVFWPVEVNPRYTSSIEVLEHASGLRALEHHRFAFDAKATVPALPPAPTCIVAKAILFAKQTIAFPNEGPWDDDVCGKRSIFDMPSFADVPSPGAVLERGRPICTMFASANTEGDCERILRERVVEVERLLYLPE